MKEIKYCDIDISKICDDCGDCDFCDMNPSKICDNCCECLDELNDWSSYKIDKVEISQEIIDKYSK